MNKKQTLDGFFETLVASTQRETSPAIRYTWFKEWRKKLQAYEEADEYDALKEMHAQDEDDDSDIPF